MLPDATGLSAMSNSLFSVCFAGIPFQIVGIIVLIVAIKVASMAINRLRTDECQQNKVMNSDGVAFFILEQDD
jgi:hypothetical protein